MSEILMKCGHAANGKDGNSNPVCVICLGTTPDARTVVQDNPNLTGRKARCTYYGGKCKSEIDSNFNLPFFNYRPDREYDEYYCGCYGWN